MSPRPAPPTAASPVGPGSAPLRRHGSSDHTAFGDVLVRRPVEVAEDAIERQLVVPRDRSGWRLDRFLTWRIPRLTRTRAQKILRSQAFTPEGRKLRPSDIVQAGDIIVIYRPPLPEPETPRTFGVLFEDQDLIVVDKPAGLPVHPTARYYENTLTSLLRTRYEGRITLTHRLDRETSGALVCARTKDAERCMKAQFESREVHKRYLALVRGIVTTQRQDVGLPLELDRAGVLKNRMRVAPPGKGLPSQTQVEVLARGRMTTLVAAVPRTGRQHQIRVHLNALGHPVVGDKLYGVDEALFVAFCETGLDAQMRSQLGLPRHALHAHQLWLRHPRTGSELEITSPLPEDMRVFFTQDGGAIP